MNGRYLTTLAIGVGLACLSPARGDDEIRVVPARIAIYRSVDLLQQNKKAPARGTNYMQLVLRLKGDELAKATRIGKIKLEEAKDSEGNQLKLRSTYYADRLGRLFRSQFRNADDDSKDEEYDHVISLNPPTRTAKSLASLKGSLVVVISETTDATIDVVKLEKLAGKSIEDETLKKLGVKADVQSFTSDRRASLRLKLTGERKDLQKVLLVSFVDDKGKSLARATPFVGFSSGSVFLNSFRPIPKGSKLKIQIETSSREKTLKFNASNLSLP